MNADGNAELPATRWKPQLAVPASRPRDADTIKFNAKIQWLTPADDPAEDLYVDYWIDPTPNRLLAAEDDPTGQEHLYEAIDLPEMIEWMRLRLYEQRQEAQRHGHLDQLVVDAVYDIRLDLGFGLLAELTYSSNYSSIAVRGRAISKGKVAEECFRQQNQCLDWGTGVSRRSRLDPSELHLVLEDHRPVKPWWEQPYPIT